MPTPKERLEIALARDPLTSRFGALVRDADDVGLAMFCWYDTPEDLRRSVLEDHAFPGDDERRPEEWGRVRRDLEALLSASPDLNTPTREGVNALTRPWFALDWWGTFDELCTGDHETARDARERFRSSQGLEDEDRPVAEEEREDFAASLPEG